MRTSNNLDMLRAVAVLYVLIDHSLKFFGQTSVLGVDPAWLGKLGVMFFFVHTCAVLMMSLERSYHSISSRTKVVWSFYLRRVFRIYPLSIFSIGTVLFFSIPSAQISAPYLITQFQPTRIDLILNLFLIQNFNHHVSIIAPLWSLPFEMQMYVLLPFIFIFLAREGRLKLLFLIWGMGFVAAYVVRPHMMFVAHFTPGVIAYVLINRIKKPAIPAWTWPFFLSLITLLFLSTGPSFISGALACLLLGLILPNLKDFRFVTINKLTHTIAKYSYGVYLSHMFCMWFAFQYLRFQTPAFHYLFYLGLLVGVPYLLFHLIENPMINAGAVLAANLFGETRSSREESKAGIEAEELEESASGL